MSNFVIIPKNDGFISHSNIDVGIMNLPENAEVYDSREDFEDRLNDFET